MSNITIATRRVEGICLRCGKVPARSGKLYCAECAKLFSAENKQRYINKKRKRQNKPTVADINRLAMENGMSYGKYVAMMNGKKK
ncbi:MAG: hypothetical protein J1F04_01630 [Oscillospiraceae bacterium]|nr:hypothetical protein [Oscillospiraceae bacterium]